MIGWQPDGYCYLEEINISSYQEMPVEVFIERRHVPLLSLAGNRKQIMPPMFFQDFIFRSRMFALECMKSLLNILQLCSIPLDPNLFMKLCSGTT